MAYLLKSISGLGLFGGGIALANVKLVKLLETGTCASGNTPYAIRNPCPPGTGSAILLLMAGIFAAIIGAGLFAARGTPSWAKDRPHRVSTFAVTWGIGFTATGAVSLLTALGNDSLGQGGKLGGLIVGITFLVMGVPVLLFALWSLIESRGSRDERPMSTTTNLGAGGGTVSTGAFEGFAAAAPQPTPGFGTVTRAAPRSEGERIAKLQTLAELRKSGALTEQEFEREKTRLLGEP
jgi:putative oligomerization/nucleic acid binding protein